MVGQKHQSPVDRYDPLTVALGFSLATRVGNLVYTSGMVGVDPNVNVPEGLAPEVRQASLLVVALMAGFGLSSPYGGAPWLEP